MDAFRSKDSFLNLGPIHTFRLRTRLRQNFALTHRMVSRPILSLKRSVTIDTMLNFDGDDDEHGDGTCKQAFKIHTHYLSSSMTTPPPPIFFHSFSWGFREN